MAPSAISGAWYRRPRLQRLEHQLARYPRGVHLKCPQTRGQYLGSMSPRFAYGGLTSRPACPEEFFVSLC